MFNHLLVPLDGSEYSESSIPISISLAQSLKAEVTLLHIIEHDAPQTVHGEPHLRTFEEASKYLKGIVKNKYPASIQVNFHIHSDDKTDVIKAIAEHHKELLSDLLVMTTHGWGGFKQIILGNNAQQIIKLGIMPVLFIPPDFPEHEKNIYIKKILVPVDVTEEHKPGLDVAMSLASVCSAEIFLINVIPTMSTLSVKQNPVGILLPQTTKRVLELQEKEAEHFIASKKAEIEKKGIKVYAEINRGYPAKIINKIANRKAINLIVIGTHGKAGLNAFWSESTAAKIAGKTKIAILFVPIQKE